MVLRLHPDIAPYKVAVLPLLKKRPEIVELCHRIKSDLQQDVTELSADTSTAVTFSASALASGDNLVFAFVDEGTGALRTTDDPPTDELRRIAAVVDQRHIDVVHTHSSKAGILGRYAAQHSGIPVIVHTIHGMSFNRTQPWWLRRAYAWAEWMAARRSHAIVTVADAMITGAGYDEAEVSAAKT